MSLLCLKSVSAGYSGRPVLKNLSFDVEKGDFTGIIGPNGSGKSTLIKAVTRFLSLQAGEIHLEGRSVSAMSVGDLARKMAVVNQYTTVDLQLSVSEYVMLGRMPYRSRWHLWETQDDRDITVNAIELACVSHLSARRFNELSGGERQAVIIARALAQQPEILLLDEPTTHLDITHQIAMLDLLRRLNREQGLTIVTVLHDLNLAGEYCDNLILLNEGSIHCHGTAEEVLTYETIEAVYKTLVVVGQNPVSKKPVVFPVPEEHRTASA